VSQPMAELGDLLASVVHPIVGLPGAIMSLGATSTTTTTTTTTAPRVHFVTVETRGQSLAEKLGGLPVHNVGLGQPWDGFRSKLTGPLPFLRTLQAHAESEMDMVVFFDGGDVMWGGCDLADFLDAYKRIAKRTGASVVFSAEINCFEQNCTRAPEIPEWVDELVKPPWHKPTRKFLNSGFYMGPVRDVVKMLEWASSNYDSVPFLQAHPWPVAGGGGHGDQGVLAEYWLDHLQDVALDYGGELCLSLCFESPGMISVDTKRRAVINHALDRAQCMIHGNGPKSSKDLLFQTVNQLMRGDA